MGSADDRVRSSPRLMGSRDTGRELRPSARRAPREARLLLVVGLQKSGTTLLKRLLEEIDVVASPFELEGDELWGNTPPFSPRRFPAGTRYQESGGERGHELDAADADRKTARVLARRIRRLRVRAPLLLNKNPYNTVRLPWLRALFPDAVILATLRRPVDNVFSLTKKFVPHESQGIAPREGWWGVKPRHWRRLRREDKLEQGSLQWSAVNQAIIDHRDCLDLIVPYHALCAQPSAWIGRILEVSGQRSTPPDFGTLRCMDGEHRTGSRYRSKNFYFPERGDLSVPASEPVEHAPLHAEQAQRIDAICKPVADRLPELGPGAMLGSCRFSQGGSRRPTPAS